MQVKILADNTYQKCLNCHRIWYTWSEINCAWCNSKNIKTVAKVEVVMRCDQKAIHRPIIVGWRTKPVYYMCNLMKGHKEKHRAYAEDELIEEW